MYKLKYCTLDDVTKHIKLVSHYLKNNEEYLEKEKQMIEAVEKSTAFYLLDKHNKEVLVFYYDKLNDTNFIGLTYWQSSNKGLLLAYTSILRLEPLLEEIAIYPYNSIPTFLSLVLEPSVMYFHYDNNYPLLIRRYSEQGNRLKELVDKANIVITE